jgi:AraC-like DNA-binding protein
MGDLLGAHIAALRGRLDDMTGDSVPFIMQSTSALLAGAVAHLDVTAAKAASLFPSAMLARIKNFITENLVDPDLGPAMIMKHFRLPQATLYNIFSRSSTTVSDFIWQQRLRRCFDDLTDPGQAHRRISDIAYGWGFTSNAHFSRTFRRAFGCSPSEARSHPWGIRRDQAALENPAFPEVLAVANKIRSRIRGLPDTGPEDRS